MNQYIDPLISLLATLWALDLLCSASPYLLSSIPWLLSFPYLLVTLFSPTSSSMLSLLHSEFFFSFFPQTLLSFLLFFILISTPIFNSLPKFTINRDTLVAKYVLLLTTNSAITSYSGQSFYLWFTKNQRYCSNSWFIYLVYPSVCE